MSRRRLEEMANRSAKQSHSDAIGQASERFIKDEEQWPLTPDSVFSRSRASSVSSVESIDEDRTYTTQECAWVVAETTDALISDVDSLIELVRQESQGLVEARADQDEEAGEALVAEADKFWADVSEELAAVPRTSFEMALSAFPKIKQEKVSGSKLSKGLEALRDAMKLMVTKIKEFFTEGKGEPFLEAVTAFMKAVKDFFTKTIPGVTSEIWSKVEEKVIIPVQEKVKLAVSHIEETIQASKDEKVKEVYETYREQVRTEADRKKLRALAEGVVNSREGREKLSVINRKDGLNIVLDSEREESLQDNLGKLTHNLDRLAAIIGDQGKTLSEANRKFLDTVGIKTGSESIDQELLGLLTKKLQSVNEERIRISEALNSADVVRGFLDKKTNVTNKAFAAFMRKSARDQRLSSKSQGGAK